MADKRYLVLARKWRPQLFDDVVGQEHITRTLRNAIASGRIHHAFLFIGSRGIGKTTTARILAKALNCRAYDAPTVTPCGECENCRSIADGTSIDVIEIDGASNNGVDNVREIRENVRMVPTSGRYKVYIIDEVHQLSLPAFNALLKTLEEPPPHAVFVLATTEAHKIPATIISRCQRYDFRRVATPRLVELLRAIVENEGIKASDEALHAIARAAEGGVRDSESILDQIISYCGDEITFKDVFDVLGLVDWNVLHSLCDAILAKDVGQLLMLVEDIVAAGKDLSQFVQEVLRYFRNLLVCKTAESAELLHLPDEEVEEMRRRAQQFSLTALVRLVEQFAELTKDFDSQLAQRIALESLLIRIAKVSVEMSVDAVIEKLVLLGAGGVAPAAPGAKPTPAPPPKPQDPPLAGPVEPAPAAPAKLRRISLTDAELARQWPIIMRRAGQENFSIGVWIGHANPVRVENDTLVLGFTAEHAHARDVLEKPEHRRAVEDALTTLTDNIRTFRTEIEAAVEAVVEQAEPQTSLPAYPSVAPQDVRTALADPHVAKVIEVFRGRIAEIKLDTGAPEEAE
jgi:DNA polymerase-3 subunit gamma/tau